jgi:glucosamine--fructose-6-phosphate aminotransferase (isomerizing)
LSGERLFIRTSLEFSQARPVCFYGFIEQNIMCGIVGYIGQRPAREIILKGLKRLEYRGYDSAGIAQINGTLDIRKAKGKVSSLEKLLEINPINSTLAVGHTRWATHGEPNDVNAHPHTGGTRTFALVHNGIIENYDVLRAELLQKGHVFQ